MQLKSYTCHRSNLLNRESEAIPRPDASGLQEASIGGVLLEGHCEAKP